MYYVVNLATHGWCRQSLGGMCVCVRACVCTHTHTVQHFGDGLEDWAGCGVCMCVCVRVCTHTHTHTQYNILVMVSKVRAMHRENPERTDEELKEALIALMSNAGVCVCVRVSVSVMKCVSV